MRVTIEQLFFLFTLVVCWALLSRRKGRKEEAKRGSCCDVAGSKVEVGKFRKGGKPQEI